MFSRNPLLAAAATLLGGCAATMDVVPDAERVQGPQPTTSLVYFVRPEVFGGTDSAMLFDGETYIGTLDENRHIAYLTSPGKHRFAVVSEAADFMEAELAPGKTYYARVRRRFGVVDERFSFDPQTDSISIRKTQRLVEQTPEVRPNDVGRKEVRLLEKRIRYGMWRYWQEWEKKPRKQELPIYSGR